MIGLDIGTTAVKAAQVQRKGSGYVVTGLARAGIGRASARADTTTATVEAIRKCLYLLRGPKQVVCGLSGPEVAVRLFDLPALPKRRLASAVEMEAAQVSPFDLQEAAVAFQVLHGAVSKASRLRSAGGTPATPNNRTTGLLVAAKKDAIARLQDLCAQAKARCTLVDVDGLALLNCLEACALRQPGQTILALNIGSAYTNLAVLSDDGQPFVQDIAYAGEGIVAQVGQSLETAPDAVVGALSGLEKPGLEPATLQAAVQKACAALAERVLETVRYHGARQAGAGVDKILLCGGLAEAGPVVETLATLLEGKVERWNPLASLRSTRAVRKSGLAEHGPLFAVALGLGMRSVRDVQD
jgi:type IV pilus assembly protein PilM